jgi:hypothetical protein
MKVAVLALGLALAATALASSASAKPPRTVGPCFSVHGRLTSGNGTPNWRIWPVGTRRMLGVFSRTGEAEFDGQTLPGALGVLFRSPKTRPVAEARGIFGDFEVCPITRRRPGWMQMVYIRSARRIHPG